MKLLYITNGINGSGGLERVLSIKASYFAEQMNYEVHVLVLNNTHESRFYDFSSNIKFHSIEVKGNPFSYFLNYKKGVQEVVRLVNPDIILVCDDGLKGFFLPSLITTKAKWIYERHVSKLIEMRDDFGFGKRLIIHLKWWLMENLAKTYDCFIVLTEGNKKEWTSLQNMQVIANPLSFYPDRSSSLDQKVVICVGKISYQKGQDLLVKAWEKVHQAHPDWQLHLYGKENLSFLDTNKLTHNIKYFPPEKNIKEKYLESSIYVMSSRFEGFGMVLIEAMACGLPCVSFDCDYGPSDIIVNQEDGYIIPKNNIIEFSEQLILLIEDSDLRKSFGNKAKQDVRRYAIENISQKWNQLFKSL
ncbi:glycosyltransferase family 4 protein [Chryseobacterium sp. POL2]|uniref:glycosyltransferase family 4 protein n=1 Tax=Chryseobacterium sp. POL2 TaxID=2713414 RepID=UPI0013E1F127|nr:glycosyltransferase family 4 protein [Chryseobacterium sp. POL2]QIG90341.1 glycosyltransferase family 4 protein [Chryseobacterium sp. POL2]